MARVVFRCDGANVPEAVTAAPGLNLKSVNSRGPTANLNLRAQRLGSTVLTSVNDLAADLVRLASYVYAADQMVSRGGVTDVFGADWKRQILLCVPVSAPEFWETKSVRRALVETLGFLTDDTWEFAFSPDAPEARQLPLDPLEVSDLRLLGDPDSVALLSGGADSLCAVVESAVLQGRRPVIVSHRPAPNLDARQKRLVDELRQRSGKWSFPSLSFAIHRMGSEAAESSQRSRAFLYASLGVAVAAELGLDAVLLADNGVVSLNLPISAQLVGAMASRGTHPKFLARFNGLAAQIWSHAPQVINPLWSRTRREGLELLRQVGYEDLLSQTLSCSRTRGRSSAVPQCGYCSQCVDRRFAKIAAGLDDFDPTERYEVDVFRDALPSGEPKTVAESYVRFANDVSDTPDEALFERFPQLYDAILAEDPDQHRTAEALCALLRRHADTTLDVMSEIVKRSSTDLVNQEVAPDSLIGLVLGLKGPDPAADHEQAANVFRPKGDAWEVSFRGKTVHIKDATGMAYIALLLAHPGDEFHVLHLATMGGKGDPSTGAGSAGATAGADQDTRGVFAFTLPSNDPLLDPQAVEEIRDRLDTLKVELTKAEQAGDHEMIGRIRHEMDWLSGELSRAKGLGGRPRAFSDPGERARKAVTAAIERSRGRIRTLHPQLGAHLDRTIKTGFQCCYRCDPPLVWITGSR